MTFQLPSIGARPAPRSRALPTAILLAVAVVARAAAAPLPAVTHSWTWAPTGTGIGWAGMAVGDLDADGNLEIVADSAGGAIWGGQYWFILEDTPAGKQLRHVSLPLAGELLALSVEQLDADPALEIVLLQESEISILDGRTLTVQATFDLGVAGVLDLAFADLDGDSRLELIVSTLADLFVFDAGTGSLLRSGEGLGGFSVDIGQADGDPELEIAVASADETGRIVDGETLTIQCTLGPYAGTQVAFGNIDDDDALEVVAARRGVGGIRAFDSSSCAAVWEIPVVEVDTFTLGDLEGDGVTELVYADAQAGPIHVLDLQSQVESWSVWNPLSGALRIAFGDLDHDGAAEIVFGAGYYSSGPDRLVIVDSAVQLDVWESVDVNGSLFGIDAGDIDGDGREELVGGALYSESGYAGGRYLSFDALGGRVEFMSEAKSAGMWRLAIADIDADGSGEICYATVLSLQGSVACDDARTHLAKWLASLGSGQRVGAMRAGDLDGDGVDDLVVSTAAADSSAVGIFVRDFAGGVEVWSSANLQSTYFASLDLLRFGQVDDDDPQEVVVADSQAGIVYVLDGETGHLESSGPAPGIVALDLVDLDLDGRLEVAWAPRSGEIQVVRPADWTVEQVLGPFAGLDAFLFSDLNGDSPAELILSAGGRLRILDGLAGSELWASPWLGARAGGVDSLRLFDREPGARQIAINLGYGLAVFEIGPVRVFCDGFESADASEWRPGAL